MVACRERLEAAQAGHRLRLLDIASAGVLNRRMLKDPDLGRLMERVGPLDPAQFAILSDRSERNSIGWRKSSDAMWSPMPTRSRSLSSATYAGAQRRRR
jgi:hypothetical protein